MENKVIIVDWGICTHKAIFALKFNPAIPATFTACNMMIGWLYRLNIDPDDIIIVACDGRNSWRKDFELAYKGDRKQKRQDSLIDWDSEYKKMGDLAERLNQGLNWHFIKINRLEADDVMAVASRYYKDREVILVTHDKDLEQMWEYPHVKIYSTYSKKWKIRPENFDLTRLQADKIKVEKTDNMITPILSEEDYQKRKLCIDLIELPDWVEQSVKLELDKIGPKNLDVQTIPFKSLWPRMEQIYNDKSKVEKYEDQVNKEIKKEERIKTKKIEAKLKEKKLKEKEINKVKKLEQEKIKLELKLQKLEKKNKEKNYEQVC